MEELRLTGRGNKLFCHVNKEGKVDEGPMELPQNWGSISGFNNIPHRELSKYGWYPLRETEQRGLYPKLMFFPEAGIVAQIPSVGQHNTNTNYILDQLRSRGEGRVFRSIPFTMNGQEYNVPNTPYEQFSRFSCFILGMEYQCLAFDKDGNGVHLHFSTAELESIIRAVQDQRNKISEKMCTCAKDIANTPLEDLAYLLETNFSDYFDDDDF